MANHWLLKTEPTTYSFDRLRREGRTVWDGVRNNLALSHMRGMKQGDQVLIYHTGAEKAVVGLARVSRPAYPDPGQDDPKLVVVDLEPEAPLPQPVPLAAIRGEPALAALPLVRMPRLSVMPVPSEAWKRILTMAGRS
ncbi:MAG TPA: EVE domain-containing protein [Gemmatimonadales bacterium]|nr:EVE domain-containing protein [Gemmatimonadales bacterium]